MKDKTREWINLAREDLRDAKILFATRSYKNCVLHCHQSIEKILKAIIVEKGPKLYRIHDLIELVEDAAIDLPEEYSHFCDNLNPHYLGTKYP